MKKKFLAGVLILAILTGVAFAGSQSQALVSLSYLNGTFWSDLTATVKQETERDTAAMYSSAAAQAGQGGVNGFTARTGVSGDRITGTAGSGLVWTAGTGVVQSGVLVDATAGAEVNAGRTLAAGHRYLADADVTVAVASQTAQWMGEGIWTVTAGSPLDVPMAMPFTDVAQGAWYYDDVAYVYAGGLFNGVTETSFFPSGKMQRCMMTTVLYRMVGEPMVNYAPLFTDIPEGQWYTAGTIWAGYQGVVAGVGDKVFAPFANVTRQEIAVILYRCAGRMGLDVGQSADLSRFGDAGSVAAWGREAVSWAVGAGILGGSDSLLLPYGDATRAEVSAMLHRFAMWSKG